jgi:two-component system cell cycle sensor histidine kinase/response regulator CckA
MKNYSQLSRLELEHELQTLRTGEGVSATPAATVEKLQRLILDLRIDQIELEIQNRELRETRQGLEEVHQHYADLYDFAPVGYLILDRNGVIQEINQTAATLVGRKRRHLLGKSLSALVAKHDLARWRSHLQQCEKQGGEKAITELDLKLRGGGLFSVRLESQPIFAGPIFATIRTVIIDISEHKQAKEKLTEQAALLDQVPDAILVRDLDDRILFWNRGSERIYGWTAEEALGRDVKESINRNMVFEFNESKQAVLEKGKWLGILRQLTKDGKEVFTECRWTLLRDGDGRPKSILAINTDITERKKIEEQLLRAQRLESIGTLTSGIAHDFNNILSPILMGVHLLQMKLSDEGGQQTLDVIRRSAERGCSLIAHLLSFASGTEEQKAVLQPKHLIKEIATILDNTFPKSITIKHSLAQDLAAIKGVPSQLHQVLMNLCINARDAMPHGGTLTIAAETVVFDRHKAQLNLETKPRSYVLITVTDTGTGIPREIAERIFDPFFTTKERGKGTGLGLSTVQGIVKSHQGFISVNSEMGRGTRFMVYLPAIASAQTALVAAPASHLPAGRGEAILVVDDEESVRQITGMTLETSGYRVLVASDGAEAVETYISHKDEIEAVLIDMMMPSMDGSATIRALMEINPQVKIIATSGLAESDRTVKATQLGAQAFLAKPFSTESLLVTLDELISKKR